MKRGLPKGKNKKVGNGLHHSNPHSPETHNQKGTLLRGTNISTALLRFKEKLKVWMAQTYFNVLQKSLPQHKKVFMSRAS